MNTSLAGKNVVVIGGTSGIGLATAKAASELGVMAIDENSRVVGFEEKPKKPKPTPDDPNRTSAFLNIRVADIAEAHREWTAAGADFLTEPKDRGGEIRAYMRDPDGHLIEVGQATGVLER